MISQADAIEELVRINLSSADSTPGCARRSQHAKDHGCVRATVTIADGLPEHLRVGLFAAPRTYEALIRFSNSREPDDRKPDVHGMAIKLLDVAGDKLVGTETAAIIAGFDEAMNREHEPHRRPPLWDGQTAGRVAAILQKFLA